jgi:uncharacterized protein YdeI (YjbR/CyaY-like superfamily)
MPEELKITLDKNKKAKEIFNKYPPSRRKCSTNGAYMQNYQKQKLKELIELSKEKK